MWYSVWRPYGVWRLYVDKYCIWHILWHLVKYGGHYGDRPTMVPYRDMLHIVHTEDLTWSPCSMIVYVYVYMWPYFMIYNNMCWVRRYTQIHVDVICSALHSPPIVLYLWTCNIITPTHLVPTLPSGTITHVDSNMYLLYTITYPDDCGVAPLLVTK